MAELLPVCLATCTCAVTIEACGVRQSTTCPMAQREEAYVFSRMDTAFTGTQTTHVTGYTYTCIVDIVGTWVSP